MSPGLSLNLTGNVAARRPDKLENTPQPQCELHDQGGEGEGRLVREGNHRPDRASRLSK